MSANGGGAADGALAKAIDTEGTPKLLMIGTRDNFCSMATFRKYCDKLPGPKKVVEVEGEDHFSMYPHLERSITAWVLASFDLPDLPSLATLTVS